MTVTGNLAAYNTYELITIDTGENSLILDCGSISLHDYRITGQGVDKPVVDVHKAFAFRNHWSGVLFNLKGTATGEGDRGGTAVRVQDVADTGFPFNLSIISDSEGDIRAYGKNARGVVLDAPGDYYGFHITVEGEDSVALLAQEEATIFYSKLTASAAGAVAASGNVRLDTCAASPAYGDSIERRIAGLSGSRFHLPARQFNSDDINPMNYVNYALGGGDEIVTVMIITDWDMDAIDTVDTGSLGRTLIPGKLVPLFQGLGLERDFPLKLVIDVRDPAVPCIDRIDFSEDDSNPYAVLYLWDQYTGPLEGLRVWRSDDEGMTWYDTTESSDIKICFEDGDALIYLHYDEITDPVQLMVELPGSGESNVVTLYSIDGFFAAVPAATALVPTKAGVRTLRTRMTTNHRAMTIRTIPAVATEKITTRLPRVETRIL